MPFALVILLLDITLVYHASRTGRLQPWAFIILMVPFFGAVAYICVEVIPEWFSGPGARQARQRVANKFDPDKRYRDLSDRLAGGDTIANRANLAAECLNVARFDEAERHFDHILSLPMGEVPQYALGKAQAQFSAKALARRLQPWTTCKSAGPISNLPRDICSMRARSPNSAALTRRLTNFTPYRLIFRVRRRRFVTDCCSKRSGARRRPGSSSTSS